MLAIVVASCMDSVCASVGYTAFFSLAALEKPLAVWNSGKGVGKKRFG